MLLQPSGYNLISIISELKRIFAYNSCSPHVAHEYTRGYDYSFVHTLR